VGHGPLRSGGYRNGISQAVDEERISLHERRSVPHHIHRGIGPQRSAKCRNSWMRETWCRNAPKEPHATEEYTGSATSTTAASPSMTGERSRPRAWGGAGMGEPERLLCRTPHARVTDRHGTPGTVWGSGPHRYATHPGGRHQRLHPKAPPPSTIARALGDDRSTTNSITCEIPWQRYVARIRRLLPEALNPNRRMVTDQQRS
jgi:hypothetical protein